MIFEQTSQMGDTLFAIPFCPVGDSLNPQPPLPDSLTEEPCIFALDSIFQPSNDSNIGPRQSLFVGHDLPMIHQTFKLRNDYESPSWIFVVLVIIVATICIYVRSYQMTLTNLMKATSNQRDLHHLLRENRFNRASSYLSIAVLFSLTTAFIAFYFLLQNDIVVETQKKFLMSPPILYLLSAAAIFLFFYIRIGLIAFLGNTFENNEATHIYIANSYTFSIIETIVIVPCLFLLFFSHFSSHIYLLPTILLMVLFLYKIIRGMYIILTNANASKFYLFYYLCIIEIIPILLLAKVIISL